MFTIVLCRSTCYDVIRRASEIVQRLQDVISPEIFSSIASAYDGARILFSVGRPFFDQASMNVNIYVPSTTIVTDI